MNSMMEDLDFQVVRAHHLIKDLHARLYTNRIATVIGSNAGPIMTADYSTKNPSLLLLGTEAGQIVQLSCESSTAPSTLSNSIFETSQKTIQTYPDAIFDVRWRDDCYAAAVGDNHVYIHDGDGQIRQCLGYHDFNIRCIRYQPSNPWILASAGRDGDIALWDLRTCDRNSISNRPINIIKNAHGKGTGRNQGSSSVTSLEFLPLEDHLLVSVGQPDYSIRIWDSRYQQGGKSTKGAIPLFQIPAPLSRRRSRAFISLAIDSRGEYLYATSSDNRVYRYLGTGSFSSSPTAIYEAPSFRTSGCFYIKSCLSPDDQYLLCGGTEGQAFIWPVTSPKCHTALALGEQRFEVSCVAWSPNGRTIFTGGEDCYSRIWRASSDYQMLDKVDFHDDRALFYKAQKITCLPETNIPRKRLLFIPQSHFSESPTILDWPSRDYIARSLGLLTPVPSNLSLTSGIGKKLRQSNLDSFLSPASLAKRSALQLKENNKANVNI